MLRSVAGLSLAIYMLKISRSGSMELSTGRWTGSCRRSFPGQCLVFSAVATLPCASLQFATSSSFENTSPRVLSYRQLLLLAMSAASLYLGRAWCVILLVFVKDGILSICTIQIVGGLVKNHQRYGPQLSCPQRNIISYITTPCTVHAALHLRPVHWNWLCRTTFPSYVLLDPKADIIEHTKRVSGK